MLAPTASAGDGASWLVHIAGVPEPVAQALGGWASQEVMRAFYTHNSPDAVKKQLLHGLKAHLARSAGKRPRIV